MRRLLSVSIVTMMTAVMTSPANSKDPSNWVSLESVLEKSAKDKTAFAYLADRCSGLFFVHSKLFSRRADTKYLAKNYSDYGTKFMTISATVVLKTNGEKITRQNIEKQIKIKSSTIIEIA